MEALTKDFAEKANQSRQLPETTHPYLAEADMKLLMAGALGLGWDLLAYECEFVAGEGGAQDLRGLEFANWRDEEEARHFVDHLLAAPPGTPLLVWCGHSHQRKTPQAWLGRGDLDVPVGNASRTSTSSRLSSTLSSAWSATRGPSGLGLGLPHSPIPNGSSP